MEKVAVGSAVSSLQRFEMSRINRKSLKKAPYNPRQIDEKARKKLRENIEEVGLVQPIVWNRRSGNIVSGHQRIFVMDAIEGRADYWLDVAVVDMDDRTERQQVIFMNNEFAMGSFDLPKLENLLKDIDFEAAGFDKVDLELMIPNFGKSPTPIARREDEDDRDDPASYDGNDEERPAAKKKPSEPRIPVNGSEGDVEHFVVMAFKSRDQRDEFLDLIKIERSEKYVSGEMIRGLIGK